MRVASDNRTVLHICTTCNHLGQAEDPPGETVAGAQLCDAVSGQIETRGLNETLRVNPVVCMANCEQGCSVAVSSPGRWTYLAGYLTPDLAGDLVDYALVYGASKTGVVMPSKRAESLRHVIVARVPAHPDSSPEKA